MRRTRPLAFAGFLVVMVAAAIGFASFSADRPHDGVASTAQDAPTPQLVSGRLTAAVLSSRLAVPSVVETSRDDAEPSTTRITIGGAAPDRAVGNDAPSETVTADPSGSTAPTTMATPTTTTTATTAPESSTTTSTAPPITSPPRTFSPEVERWRPLVATYFPGGLVDQALSVMECESRGDPNAENPSSTAAGLYQFIASTWDWASANAGFTGVSVFDPEANIATAAFLVEYSVDRDDPPWQHWTCHPD